MDKAEEVIREVIPEGRADRQSEHPTLTVIILQVMHISPRHHRKLLIIHAAEVVNVVQEGEKTIQIHRITRTGIKTKNALSLRSGTTKAWGFTG